MPNAPRQNIDDRLRAYAQERRQSVPGRLEMPPGTRQRLQAEVDRCFGANQTAGGSGGTWWKTLWPYLSFGGALAGLAVCLLVVRSDRRMQELRHETARSERAARATPAPSEQPAVALKEAGRKPDEALKDAFQPATPSQVVAATDEVKSKPVEPPALSAAPAPSAPPSPATVTVSAPVSERRSPAAQPVRETLEGKDWQPTLAAPTPTEGGSRYGRAVRPETLTRSAPAVARPAAGVPIDSSAATTRALDRSDQTLSKADTRLLRQTKGGPAPAVGAAASGAQALVVNNLVQNQLASNRQRFQRLGAGQVYRRNPNSPARPNVLNSFHVQQAGNQIQIVDADGSIYEGSLALPSTVTEQTVPATSSSAGVAAVTRTPARIVQKQALGEAHDFVSQQFSFRASGTNRSSRERVVFDGSVLLTNQIPGQSVPFGRSIIQGRAVIGRTEMEIHAVPVKE